MTILAILAVVAAAFFGSALSLTVAAFFVVRKAKEYMAPPFNPAAFEAGIPPVTGYDADRIARDLEEIKLRYEKSAVPPSMAARTRPNRGEVS